MPKAKEKSAAPKSGGLAGPSGLEDAAATAAKAPVFQDDANAAPSGVDAPPLRRVERSETARGQHEASGARATWSRGYKIPRKPVGLTDTEPSHTDSYDDDNFGDGSYSDHDSDSSAEDAGFEGSVRHVARRARDPDVAETGHFGW